MMRILAQHNGGFQALAQMADVAVGGPLFTLAQHDQVYLAGSANEQGCVARAFTDLISGGEEQTSTRISPHGILKGGDVNSPVELTAGLSGQVSTPQHNQPLTDLSCDGVDDRVRYASNLRELERERIQDGDDEVYLDIEEETPRPVELSIKVNIDKGSSPVCISEITVVDARIKHGENDPSIVANCDVSLSWVKVRTAGDSGIHYHVFIEGDHVVISRYFGTTPPDISFDQRDVLPSDAVDRDLSAGDLVPSAQVQYGQGLPQGEPVESGDVYLIQARYTEEQVDRVLQLAVQVFSQDSFESTVLEQVYRRILNSYYIDETTGNIDLCALRKMMLKRSGTGTTTVLLFWTTWIMWKQQTKGCLTIEDFDAWRELSYANIRRSVGSAPVYGVCQRVFLSLPESVLTDLDSEIRAASVIRCGLQKGLPVRALQEFIQTPELVSAALANAAIRSLVAPKNAKPSEITVDDLTAAYRKQTVEKLPRTLALVGVEDPADQSAIITSFRLRTEPGNLDKAFGLVEANLGFDFSTLTRADVNCWLQTGHDHEYPLYQRFFSEGMRDADLIREAIDIFDSEDHDEDPFDQALFYANNRSWLHRFAHEQELLIQVINACRDEEGFDDERTARIRKFLGAHDTLEIPVFRVVLEAGDVETYDWLLPLAVQKGLVELFSTACSQQGVRESGFVDVMVRVAGIYFTLDSRERECVKRILTRVSNGSLTFALASAKLGTLSIERNVFRG